MTASKSPKEVWNGRYDAADGLLFGEAPNAWLAAQGGRLRPGGQVLCPADGDGRNSVWLALRGMQVTAFDLAEIGVDHARAHARSSGLAEQGGRFVAGSGGTLEFGLSDIADWPWDADSVDAVAAIYFQFAGPALRAKIFEGIGRTLRSGGLLLIEGYGPRQLVYRTGGPGVAENLYTLGLLTQAFEGWDVLASRDIDTDLSEGAAHSGRSHVISMVLRKPD